MKLPNDAMIAPIKLYGYLLVWRAKDDKSRWLATAGFSLDNWEQLEDALRALIATTEAVADEETRFGQMYVVSGILIGPNGKALSVRTVWITESETAQTKFVTLYPERS